MGQGEEREGRRQKCFPLPGWWREGEEGGGEMRDLLPLAVRTHSAYLRTHTRTLGIAQERSNNNNSGHVRAHFPVTEKKSTKGRRKQTPLRGKRGKKGCLSSEMLIFGCQSHRSGERKFKFLSGRICIWGSRSRCSKNLFSPPPLGVKIKSLSDASSSSSSSSSSSGDQNANIPHGRIVIGGAGGE